MYYVGIDWADQKYDITIVDRHGTIISQNMTIKKNAAGFEQLLDKLRQLSADPQQVQIGIETPNNLVVDFLVDMGYAVLALFPGAMKSLRKRYRTSGARDDQFDAFVIADTLRTDQASPKAVSIWRAVDFGSEWVREMRLLARDHHDLIAEQVRLRNSLRSTLKEYYPEYIQFFTDVACTTSLAFLQAYPDFNTASQLTRQQLTDFFKEHHWRRRQTINSIYERLHGKHLQVPAALSSTKKHKALACVKRLQFLAADIEQYARRLKALVEQHPDGQIFLSYPGVSYITAARLLALFGDNRALYANVTELQGRTGTCPVTEKTGDDYKIIYFRRACNKFYRDVMQLLAFSSLRFAAWAKAFYQKHRAQGKTHSHALRCLANLHLRLLFAMWKNKTRYDENHFLAQRARHLIANRQA
jgi:transposase